MDSWNHHRGFSDPPDLKIFIILSTVPSYSRFLQYKMETFLVQLKRRKGTGERRRRVDCEC